jgi:hypothetical protein
MSRICLLCGFFLLAGFSCAAQAPQTQPSPSQDEAKKVPVMDGALGPCSLDLTVTASDGKPVYAAAVKVRIAYGFAGMRKLDLEASTNIDGKVKFTGLPSRVRRPPLEFQASKDQLVGTATYDPASECQAKHNLALKKPNAQPSK